MKQLLAGIKSRFEANGTLSAAYTSLALMQTEDEVDLPYAVVSYVNNVPTHSFGGTSKRLDFVDVTIDLWHTSADTLATHADTLDGLFDHTAWALASPLEVVGGLLRERSGPSYEGHSAANGTIYRMSSTYRFIVDRS